MAKDNNSPINNQFNVARAGLDMDSSLNNTDKGKLSYALNATIQNFDGNSVNYQNEMGNTFCLQFPEGFILIGSHYIQEQYKHIFFLSNPETLGSQIGYMVNNDCQYHILTDADCLNFNPKYPIHKIYHRITNCSTEIYWTDGLNVRRYMNIDDIPLKKDPGSDDCNPTYLNELDCNRIKMIPDFDIPKIEYKDVISGGETPAGTYQFAIQYSDAQSSPLTSYYSVTNPLPLGDPSIISNNFNYNVGKSIILDISNLDTSGLYQYFNLAVITTVNNISTPYLVGTYFIEGEERTITYTGQNSARINLSMDDIFERFPYYDVAQDLTTAGDILIWDQLTSIERLNFQEIATNIRLQWVTYRLPADEDYSDEKNAANLRGYLRDEVYAFEFVPLFRNGKQFDGFHIPGRSLNAYDNSLPDIPDTNPDFIGEPTTVVGNVGYSPYWKIYNNARDLGEAPSLPNIGNATPHRYGEFAYWESEETYPCNNDVWGSLAGKKIRHHKFPDVSVSPVIDSKNSLAMGNVDVFPIGVMVDVEQVYNLIQASSLTQEQKDNIVGFKIARGDRSTNKSIIAKGMLRNTGSYEREEQTYYFPNYPYNDLNPDPFLNEINNAYSQLSSPWLVICDESGEYEMTDPNTNKRVKKEMVAGEVYEFCSVDRPITLSGKALIGPAEYDVWWDSACDNAKGHRVYYNDPFTDDNSPYKHKEPWLSGWSSPSGCDSIYGRTAVGDQMTREFPFIEGGQAPTDLQEAHIQPEGVVWPISQGGRRSTLNCKEEKPFNGFKDEDLKRNQILNSPDTSFGQPFLGNILKLESVMYGSGVAHFVEVKDNAKYKLISKEAQIDALDSSRKIGAITNPFNAGAMFAAYQAYLTIYINGITRKNYAYSFNSTADYNSQVEVPNNQGIKQRELDIKRYLIPVVQSVESGELINNYNRETSVFLKTDENETPLPFPSDSPNMAALGIKERSRFTISEENLCNAPAKETPITVTSYYASLKNHLPNQWGQIYSYEVVDTGFQYMFGSSLNTKQVVFGGDTFINRFAYKTKLPFFIDNRVGAPDDSDIFYDEIGNIAYPKYWHSSRSILEDYELPGGQIMSNFVSYKAHNFDCPNDPSTIPASTNASTYRTYYDGYFYLFAYGIPNFYCETSYNVDLRQAFNNREGDFWPHVSTGIPDDWVQESFVSIANDNTYTYNVTYSKQNKETTFTHLPPDWKNDECLVNYPFRAIYSDVQSTNSDVRVNNWLIYRPVSFFDFPQNYGKLTSLDGIQNKAILARFENKSLLYNSLLTIDTSNPKAAYIGNPRLFDGAPPIDFAETDLGYVGSQHKFLLKVPQGQISVDAKRGQVFLIQGSQVKDLTALGSGVNRFMRDHLPFNMLEEFPNIPVDNHFFKFGLHGAYDAKFNRFILTKIDYEPLVPGIQYDEQTGEFFIEEEIPDPPIQTTTTSTTT